MKNLEYAKSRCFIFITMHNNKINFKIKKVSFAHLNSQLYGGKFL